MARKIRQVNDFEYNHPFLHFVFVRPAVWIGKVWLQLLVRKHHLWAVFNPAFLRRLTWFGPARSPLDSHPAPILVLAGSARQRSTSDPIGDYESATEQHD